MEQISSSTSQNFNSPPPPPTFNDSQPAMRTHPPMMRANCIKCGKAHGLSSQTFLKRFVSPVALLGIFVGLLPYFLLRLLLTTRHQITTHFCAACWANFRYSEYYSLLINVIALIIFSLGVVFGFEYSSFGLWAVAACFSIALLIAGSIYRKRVSPKFKMINEKVVVIVAPNVGEIQFFHQK